MATTKKSEQVKKPEQPEQPEQDIKPELPKPSKPLKKTVNPKKTETPTPKLKTKTDLEKEKLEAEIKALNRSPWEKVSTYISVFTILVTTATVWLIWSSKSLEL